MAARLTKEEKDFIDVNWTNPNWTDEKLAQKMNRNIVTIRAYRKQKGYLKTTRGKIDRAGMQDAKYQISSNAGISDKENYFIQQFKTSSRFRSLQDKLVSDELEFFIEQWAAYHLQFEDMTASEEDALELLIIMKLRIHTNQKALKDNKLYERDLEKQLLVYENSTLDVEVEQQRRLREMMISNNRQQIELNKEYRELVDKYEKILRSMNATHEQREQNNKIGEETFLKLVRQFDDRDRRREIGKYNDLFKQAVKKKTAEFKKPYQFSDSVHEPILMLGKDYTEKSVEEDKEIKNDEVKEE